MLPGSNWNQPPQDAKGPPINRLTTSLTLYLQRIHPIYALSALQITISWVTATATALATLGIRATFCLRQKHRRDTSKATDDGRTIAAMERFTTYKILGYVVPPTLGFIIPETPSTNDLAAYSFCFVLCVIMYSLIDPYRRKTHSGWQLEAFRLGVGLRTWPVALRR